MVREAAAPKRAFLTLDLEPDHCDLVEGNRYESFEGVGSLLDVIRDEELPLTVFATGKVLEERADIVRRFVEAGAEIELHGYSHKRTEGGTEAIARGLEAYRRFFGASPRGYRAPLGMTLPAEIELLSREGFLFDSSLFPSIFPGRFCNVSSSTDPFIHPGTELLEIPISVLPVVRYPVSLSYIQLASRPAFRLLSCLVGMPDTLVVDFHLHDVFPSSVFGELTLKWKLIYSRFFLRNRGKGLADFRKLVSLLKSRGYGFGRMMDLHDVCMERLSKPGLRDRMVMEESDRSRP